MKKNRTSLELLTRVADNLKKVKIIEGVNGKILAYTNANSNPYVYSSFCLCGFLRTLYMEQIISNDEKQMLTKIIEMHKPKIHSSNLFWWPTTNVCYITESGGITIGTAEMALMSRKSFIDKLIKIHSI